MDSIQIFDIIVVALVTVLGLKGLFRGFTKEFFGLVGIVGGVFIASRIAKDTGGIIDGFIPIENDNTLLLVGFVVSLIIFWILAYIIGTALEKVFTLSGLGILDKVLGFTFGAGKIFLLFSIIAYAVSQVKAVNDNLQPKLKDSIMFPILKDAGGYIVKLDTSDFQQQVTQQLDGVVNSAKETIKEMSQEELKKQAEVLKEQLEETTSGN